MQKTKVIIINHKQPQYTTNACIYKLGMLISFVLHTTGFVEPPEKCCGKRVNGVDVYCGGKAYVNGTEVYGASCENPSSYISWDGVHYTEAANHWFVNHIVDGSLSDNSIPLAQACHRARDT